MRVTLWAIVLLVSQSVYGQKYHQKIFDSLGWDQSIGWSMSKSHTPLLWQESSQQRALIEMYLATSYVKYLHTLIKRIGNIIDRRDDLRSAIGLAPIVDYRGSDQPGVVN